MWMRWSWTFDVVDRATAVVVVMMLVMTTTTTTRMSVVVGVCFVATS
jgi:hypothetical protein